MASELFCCPVCGDTAFRTLYPGWFGPDRPVVFIECDNVRNGTCTYSEQRKMVDSTLGPVILENCSSLGALALA